MRIIKPNVMTMNDDKTNHVQSVPVDTGALAGQVILDVDNNLISLAHLNWRSRQLPINNDHSTFHAIGWDAVMSVAVRHVVRTVETSFAHCEVVLDVEAVNAPLRRTAIAFTLANIRYICVMQWIKEL